MVGLKVDTLKVLCYTCLPHPPAVRKMNTPLKKICQHAVHSAGYYGITESKLKNNISWEAHMRLSSVKTHTGTPVNGSGFIMCLVSGKTATDRRK
jgi:hypothetical protein